MHRTQVYLSADERGALAELAEATGKNVSELIRLAVDRLIAESSPGRREEALRRAAGLWKHRRDLPDFRALRSRWDRA